MLGAIIGDLAGSIYEYDQIKKVHQIKVENIIEDNAFFSDDSILTIAILDAILSNKNYESKLKEYGKKYETYLPEYKPYFNTVFSPGFSKWVNGDYIGNSMGNGAMMRISPVGYLFDTKEEVLENARLATIPSHNDEISIKSAQTIALIIYYFKKGYSKNEVIEMMNLIIKKPVIDKFNYTCKDTLDLCLYSIFTSNTTDNQNISSLTHNNNINIPTVSISNSNSTGMFGNIGGKIKSLAQVITWLGIIVSVIWGVVLMSTDEAFIPAGLIIALLGSLISWISSFVLYSFGQLIENTDKLVELSKK